MTVIPFDERSSSWSSLMAWPDAPGGHLPGDDKKQQAVDEFLEHGLLSHAFGRQGEYKVRTTLITRPTWQYRSCVLRHGKAIKGAFFPIIVDYQPSALRGMTRPLGAEDSRLSFAQQAVDVHFTRCAALREYLMLSALYEQPPTRSRGWYILLVPLIGIAVMVVYGFWTHAFRIDSGQPPEIPAPVLADQLPIRQSKDVLLSASSHPTSRNSVNGEGSRLGSADPAETSTAISVANLLALQVPPEKADQTVRASSPGSAASDIQVGDMLHVTGWVQRISRAPDSTYHLYVSPNRRAGAQVLVATVPPPHQAQGSPAGQAQLQAVRTFIRQQLLRQQEPSLRGSVMQRPIFVQLTGQLSIPAVPPTPSQGKRSQPAAARWEIRPILDIQFTTPAEFSDGSGRQ